MKKLFTLLFVTLLLQSNLFSQILANAGAVDSTFNNGDFTFTGIDTIPAGGFLWGGEMQSDGKIVALLERNGNHIVRFNTDGTLDESFGLVQTPERARSLKVLSDDRILIGTRTPSILIMLDADGVRDESFVSDTVDVWLYGTGEQPDGKLLGTGWNFSTNAFEVHRFNTDGSLDASFGTDGLSTLSLGDDTERANDFHVLDDGSILVMGWSLNLSFDPAWTSVVYKLDNTGKVDSSYGTDGLFAVDSLASLGDFGRNTILLSDGKLLLYGRASDEVGTDTYSTRINADGSLDITYGDNGYVIDRTYVRPDTSINFQGIGFTPEINATTSKMAADGKIIVGGSFNPDTLGSPVAIGLMRFNEDGSRDASFGDNGLAVAGMDSLSLSGFKRFFPDADGNILVMTNTTRTGGPNGFFTDLTMIKFLGSDIVGTLDFGLETNSFMVFPNPIAERCTMQFTLNAEKALDVFLTDVNGKRISNFYTNQKFGEGDHTLDLAIPNGLATGNYFVTIAHQGHPVTIQIFKK